MLFSLIENVIDGTELLPKLVSAIDGLNEDYTGNEEIYALRQLNIFHAERNYTRNIFYSCRK